MQTFNGAYNALITEETLFFIDNKNYGPDKPDQNSFERHQDLCLQKIKLIKFDVHSQAKLYTVSCMKSI